MWESYRPQDREGFTWMQFRERFRSHPVLAGVMKMKKKEFLALKQVINRIRPNPSRFLLRLIALFPYILVVSYREL